ncbi:uncharacterized protein MELLADRAFT_57718 [Melampsora larici-populina 98AG31]|uniref:Uncharacterized protein n=1 Tax=Melampsora larici-populina (strain 98AG31 / pathotype 3-4-7) TaxID=747676 RepID=F4S5U9_MELLP|nr:uncharacterized protein MELLADRAFT_57718 [Melampsora larici-populina 98AG31]EGF99962.1 hypothetical protein MELLADRAFT_57718 [Melampsora larici-populina 98AG31]
MIEISSSSSRVESLGSQSTGNSTTAKETADTRRSNLQLPNNKSIYKTFIDHGTEFDKEDYPTHPNGETVYVNEPEH